MTTPYDREELLRHILLVNALRQNVALLSDELRQERDRFDAAHEEQIAHLADTRTQLNEAEERLRDLTVIAYDETGQRKPAPGVSIRMATEFEYDAGAALAWAKERGMALALDRKAFEGIARVTEINFVRRLEIPKATIATQLPADDVLALLPLVSPTTQEHAPADDEDPFAGVQATPSAPVTEADEDEDPFAEDDLSDLQEPAVRHLPAGGDA